MGRPKNSKKRKLNNFKSKSKATTAQKKKRYQWNTTPVPGASIHDSQGMRDQRRQTARTKTKRPNELLSSPSENTVAAVSPSQRVSSSQHTAAQTLAGLVSSPSENIQAQDATLSQNSAAQTLLRFCDMPTVSETQQNSHTNTLHTVPEVQFRETQQNADTCNVPEVTDDNISEIRLKLGLESNVNIKRVQTTLKNISPDIYNKLSKVDEGNKLQMQNRQFEIDMATINYKMCNLCSRHYMGPGAIQAGENPIKRTGIYKTNGVVEQKFRRQAEVGDVLIDICKMCTSELNIFNGKAREEQLAYNNKQTTLRNRKIEYAFHGIERPVCLQGLTMVEKAVIAQIQVVHVSKILKFGQMSFSGHTLFVSRKLDTYKLQKTLPLLPEEISVVVIKRRGSNGSFHSLHCRRHIVQKALQWLVEHAPAYKDVIIDPERLAKLPVDGDLNVSVFELNNDSPKDTEDRTGPAPDQVPVEAETESGLSYADSANDATKERASNMFDLAAKAASVGFAQEYAPRSNLSLEDPMLWGAAFPCEFMPNSKGSDYPAAYNTSIIRCRKPKSLTEWASYIFQCFDMRYAMNPVLVWTVFNLIQRDQTYRNISYKVRQQSEAAPLNREELIALIQGDNANRFNAESRNVQSYMSSVHGSPAYWNLRRREVQALCRHSLNKYNQLPTLFMTGSCAEYHWIEMHKAFKQVLENAATFYGAQTNNDVSKLLQLMKNNNMQKTILRLPGIINEVFIYRTQCFFKRVLQQGLGVTFYWYRFEFAKSRGGIHFHALVYIPSLGKHLGLNLDSALHQFCFDTGSIDDAEKKFVTAEDKAALKVADILTKYGLSMDALHPSGRKRVGESDKTTTWYKKRVCIATELQKPEKDRNEKDAEGNLIPYHTVIGEDVPPDLVGNIDKWRTPEGLIEPNPTDGKIGQKFAFQIAEGEEDEDLSKFCNWCLLHSCSSYCLRRKKKRKRTDSDTGSDFEMHCRFGFGKENKSVCCRTDGKPLSKRPRYTIRDKVMHFEGARDHPRLIQAPKRLARIWRGNFDTQIFSAIENDLINVTVADNTDNTMDWCEQTIAHFAKLEADKPDAFKEFRNTISERNYINKATVCETAIEYTTGYAGKAEVSSAEGTRIFEMQVKSSKENASLQKIAVKTGMAIMRRREVCTGEALMTLLGKQLYSCSHQFKRLSINSYRTVDVSKSAEKSLDEPAVKVGIVGNFFRRDKKYHDRNLMTYAENKRNEIVYPTPTRYVSWPVTEEYAKQQLLLYLPHITSSKDLLIREKKNGIPHTYFETHVEAFEHYLRQSDSVFPKSLHNEIKRKVLANCLGLKPVYNAPAAKAAVVDTPPDPERPPEPGAEDITKNSESNADTVDINIDGEINLANDLSIFGKIPLTDDMKAQAFMTRETGNDTDKNEKNLNFIETFNISGKDVTNVIDNEGQRHFICCVLHCCIQHYKTFEQTAAQESTMVETPSQFVAFLSGVAGGGKSYVLELVCDIVKMLYGEKYGALKVAPTGIAAIACGGNVVDKILKVQRNEKSFVKLSPTSDDLTIRQDLFRKTKIILVDEFSMWGLKLLGHYVGRCNELFNNGVHDDNNHGEYFGGIPMTIFTGDLKQLQPVLDIAPYTYTDGNATPLKLMGKLAYDSIRHHFILDESVRQGQDKRFIQMLEEARNGNISEDNYTEWNKRTLIQTRKSFESMLRNDKALFLTPTNARKDKILEKYIRTADNVVVYQSQANTRFARSENPNKVKAGLMARIPLTSYFFIGMMVKMTVNVDVKAGLSNGARGIVKDLYFDGDELQYILLDMPTYKGQRLSNSVPRTYCLIGKFNMFSSDFKHWRNGFPLQVGKADTIHSSQGITAGEDEQIFDIIIDGWEIKWENRWPGCFYVAVSRVKERHNLFFSTPLDGRSLGSIGKSKAFDLIHTEEQKTKDAAFNKRRADLHANRGTKEHFTTLLSEFFDIVERKWKDKNDPVSECILSNAEKWKHSLAGITIEAAQAAGQCTFSMMMCTCGK